ncbi:MAG: hypothetical protein COA94_03580 [Rickettsiales bacterium]|nr:MAG: hypothetical protein COA94_03580 [Rickettsiales bacterium]
MKSSLEFSLSQDQADEKASVDAFDILLDNLNRNLTTANTNLVACKKQLKDDRKNLAIQEGVKLE